MERWSSLGSLGSFGMPEPLQVGGMLRLPSLGGAAFSPLYEEPAKYKPIKTDEDFEELFFHPCAPPEPIKAPEPAQKAVKANTAPEKAPKTAPKAKKGKAPDAPKEVPADFVLPFKFKEGINETDKALIENTLREIESAMKRRDEAKAKFARIKAGDMYRNKSPSVRKGLEERFQDIVKRENKRCEELLRWAEMCQAYV